MKSISIVIPVFNMEKYLVRCLDSVVHQTYQNLEIILVNDGSTDTSPIICNEYAKLDKRIRVIHQTNKGLPCARNAGLDVATGDYIGFIDSDDYIELDMYEYLINLAMDNNADIACCGVNCIFDKANRIESHSSNNIFQIMSQERAFETFQLFDNCMACSVWNKIYKREIVSSLRFKNFRRIEDVWYMGQCILHAQKIVFGGACKYNYCIRQGSITKSRFSEKSYDFIKVADCNYAIFKELYPQNKMAELGKIHLYIVFINELIMGGIKKKKIILETQKLIRKNFLFIIKCADIKSIRKTQICLLGISYYIYQNFYKIYMNITGKRFKQNID